MVTEVEEEEEEEAAKEEAAAHLACARDTMPRAPPGAHRSALHSAALAHGRE